MTFKIPEEVIEKVARSMMDTVFHKIDVATATLDWTGNDVWGCDFAEMSRAALTAAIESGWVVERGKDARELQGGFVIGDVVEYIGKYKNDEGWAGETFIICEVQQRESYIQYTIRANSERWTDLTDGLLQSDLRLTKQGG